MGGACRPPLLLLLRAAAPPPTRPPHTAAARPPAPLVNPRSCTSDTSYYENIVEQAAKQRGYDPAAYSTRQFIVPTWSNCYVAGRAVIGGQTATYLGWQGYTYPGAAIHESGHSLGLHHARWAGAGGTPLRVEYADFSSSMSNVGVGGVCYNLPQQAFLGWNTPRVLTPAQLGLGSTIKLNMSDTLASSKGERGGATGRVARARVRARVLRRSASCDRAFGAPAPPRTPRTPRPRLCCPRRPQARL